jgi:hypothetical protein
VLQSKNSKFTHNGACSNSGEIHIYEVALTHDLSLAECMFNRIAKTKQPRSSIWFSTISGQMTAVSETRILVASYSIMLLEISMEGDEMNFECNE